MTPLPAISVILPVRDSREYVCSALSQLVAQTFRDFEVVVVDDGSIDDTVQLAAGFIGSLKIAVVKSPGRGVASARNYGLRCARGRYVWFVDVDDRWSPRILELMVRRMEKDMPDVVVCRAVQKVSGYEKTRMIRGRSGSATLDRSQSIVGLLDGSISGHLWNKLFRVVVLGSDPFPPMRSKSDLAGLLGLVPRLQSVGLMDEPLYCYVVRGGSITNGGYSTPGDLVECSRRLDGVLAECPERDILASAALVFRYRTAVLSTVGEVWRFGERAQDGVALERAARRSVRLSESARLARAGQVRLAIQCGGVAVFPWALRWVFAFRRRQRWNALRPRNESASALGALPLTDS